MKKLLLLTAILFALNAKAQTMGQHLADAKKSFDHHFEAHGNYLKELDKAIADLEKGIQSKRVGEGGQKALSELKDARQQLLQAQQNNQLTAKKALFAGKPQAGKLRKFGQRRRLGVRTTTNQY